MNVETSDLDVGDRVIDRDAEGTPSPARVVDMPDETAEEYYIDAVGATVADLNDEYPSDSQVASVAFEADLNRRASGWRDVLIATETPSKMSREDGQTGLTHQIPQPRAIFRHGGFEIGIKAGYASGTQRG